MNISPEFFDLLKIVVGGYLVFVLNRTERIQRELFRRIRALELAHAANHGLGHGVIDEDP